MTEGRVYVTTWSRGENGTYRVWVKRNSKLAAEGATFEEADRQLWEVIGLATGDGENQRQYVPPPPDIESAGAIERARFWELGTVGRAVITSVEGLFEGGLCDNCLKPRGPRTEHPLELSAIDAGYHGASATLPHTVSVGPRLKVFAAEFIALLTSDERVRFEWRPLAPSKRRKRKFFELVPRTAPIPQVGAIGRATYNARCAECGWTWLVPDYVKGLPFTYLSERDVPAPTPSLLAIGRASEASLVATPDRWNALAGKPGMKGIAGSVVSVITESAVERSPVYKPRARERWKGRP